MGGIAKRNAAMQSPGKTASLRNHMSAPSAWAYHPTLGMLTLRAEHGTRSIPVLLA